MESGISVSDLSNAADIIADTVRGISGTKVVSYSNFFASKHNIPIPHATYPFLAANKRTALLENLRRFPPEIQFALLMQLCDDRSLTQNEDIQGVRRMITERYSQFATEESGPAAKKTPPSVQKPPIWAVPPSWPAASTPAKSIRPYDIFFSYSHEDEELMNHVRDHLVVFDRQGLIRKWWDRKLVGGQTIDRSITHYLASSDIILLFVSSSFLASDYCYDVEMKQALEQHEKGRSVVVPVILRACSWRAAPIGKLLALPTDGRPLTQWQDRDEGANVIAEGVMRIVSDLHSKNLP